MALAARICRKVRGLLSFGWLWRPGTRIWCGSEAAFKGHRYPRGVREGHGYPHGAREGHGYPHDVCLQESMHIYAVLAVWGAESMHIYAVLAVWGAESEQNLCIFTLFSLSGEQHLCIFTLFSLSGEQNLCIFTLFLLLGNTILYGVREGHGYPHGVLNNSTE